MDLLILSQLLYDLYHLFELFITFFLL